MAKKTYDYQFKLLLIGDSSVGKTSILKTYTSNDQFFDSSHIPTIGIDFKIKTIKIKDKIVKLQIWDTAGQERFVTITAAFYRDAHGIMLVYDVTNSESFDHIGRWMRNIDEVNILKNHQIRSEEEVVKMLIANKCDMDNSRIISKEQGDEVAKRYKVPFFETSAKDNINIDVAFNNISTLLLDKQSTKLQATQDAIESQKIELNNSKTKTNDTLTSCCSYSKQS